MGIGNTDESLITYIVPGSERLEYKNGEIRTEITDILPG